MCPILNLWIVISSRRNRCARTGALMNNEQRGDVIYWHCILITAAADAASRGSCIRSRSLVNVLLARWLRDEPHWCVSLRSLYTGGPRFKSLDKRPNSVFHPFEVGRWVEIISNSVCLFVERKMKYSLGARRVMLFKIAHRGAMI